MKVTTETVATREVVLTIEPDQETVRKALQKAARQISRRRPVPGFRPGRAPYAMVERLVGKEIILNEALNQLAPDLYRQAIEETGIEPYTQGQLEVESEDPLILKVRVPLVPTVNLGDYKSLRIEPEPEVAVTEEMLDQEIERIRRQNAEYEPLDRPAEQGDQLVAAVIGKVGGETVIDQASMEIDLNDELEPPGFGEALLGVKAGETREFSLTYPEDFEDENLAGKTVDFRVSVATVRKVKLPPIDDDLAKMAGDYETLADLREALAVEIKQRLEREREIRETETAIKTLVENAEVEYPEAALEREIDLMIEQERGRLQQMGFTLENYLRMINRTEEDLRESLREQARQTLVERLVLNEFIRAENIKADSSEVNQRLKSIGDTLTAQYGDEASKMMEDLASQGLLISVYNEALTSKAVRYLRAMLTGRLEEFLAESTETEEKEPSEEAEETPQEEAPASPEGETVNESLATESETTPEANEAAKEE
ncbi:MAG: trigger factor [Anaerolineae bacterium]|nr:trigger factor [Anaerolineae bacterium]